MNNARAAANQVVVLSDSRYALRWSAHLALTNKGRHLTPASERGAVLAYSLVMLLLLTILGVTAVTTSSLQEKMAGNLRDQSVAALAGDSILRDGEEWLYTQTSRPTPVCDDIYDSTNRVRSFNCLPEIAAADDTWWTSKGFTPTEYLTQVSQQPRYVNEWLQDVPDSPAKSLNYERGKEANYYRINGWSAGVTDFVRGWFQDTYRKRFN